MPPVQTAMALARSAGGKIVGRIDVDSGMISAAPAPMSARPAISQPVESASIAITEATPNATSPATSSFLRPNRSPKTPAGSSRAANTTR